MLKVNDQAPDFKLPSTSGKLFSLGKDGKNKPCILYFYPKDFTPGCTKEACEFRDSFSQFRDLNIDVYGISRDSIETHLKFKEKHRLPFDLLSDFDGSVTKQYGALIPVLKIPRRVTYLLNADHTIKAVYEDMFGASKHIKTMVKEVTTIE
ncbi:MAG: peroxiredoxin [Bacteroidota bacterium]